MSDAQSLTSRTARGMAWAYGSYAAGRALVLVATAILARLLSPSEFGVVALALTFMAFLDMIGDLGMAESLLIVDEREVEEKAETSFAVVVVMGAALFAGSWLLAPAAAAFYDEDQLKSLMPALGATFLFKSLGATHYALAQKRIDFRSRTFAELVEVVARGAIGIGLAFAGAGVWSLVAGYIAGSVAMTIAIWILVPWRPRLRPRRAHLRELMGFGAALTGVGIVAALTLNVDKILIGSSLGSAPLGLYTLASKLPELVLINLTVIAGRVLFPAFAAVDRAALGRGVVTSLRYALILVLPAGAFLGVLAEPLIVTAFGDQWRSATTAMQLFTVMALLSPITLICGTVWKATGQAAMLLRFALLELVTLLPAVAIVVDHGIAAVAACQAGSTVVVISVSLPLIMRMIDMRPATLAGVVGPPLLAAAAMAGVLVGVDAVLAEPVAVIAAGAVLGSAVYAGLMWLLVPSTLRELLGLMLPRMRVTPPPEPGAEDGAPAAVALMDEGPPAATPRAGG